MDDFQLAMNKEISVGGIKCPCCTPLNKRWKRKKDRSELRQRARSRLKNDDRKLINKE
jgi:hypothetical protein